MRETPRKLGKVQETIRQDNFNPIIEEESKAEITASQFTGAPMSGMLSPSSNLNEDAPGGEIEDNSQLEQITPFSIKNQTTNKITIFQGGIIEEVRPNLDVSQYSRLLQTEGGMRTSEHSGGAFMTNQNLGGKKVF